MAVKPGKGLDLTLEEISDQTRTLQLEDAQDLVTGHGLHLRHAEGVAERHTNLRPPRRTIRMAAEWF